jgi:hypothetical protein
MDVMAILRAFAYIALVVGTTLTGFAQETKAVTGVKGEWEISNDITPIQARSRAIEQAKAEALREAGVPEYVAESDLSYKTDQSTNNQDIHKSLTLIDVSGEIASFEVIREEKRMNEFGNLMYEAWINATVALHRTSKDPGFTMDVKGIRDSYHSPDALAFDIVPAKEGFLNVFILGDNESTHLYPNKIEKREKFEAGTLYPFPRSKALDYEVTSKESVEVNYVVLLYTKSEISFMGEETSDNILRFIAAIDPSQKCVKSYSILIKH